MAKKNSMGMIHPKKIQETIHGIVDKKIQMGYSKKEIRRSEGEMWQDEQGKEWEMKKGIVSSIPKFQDIRVPLFCSKCQRLMGKKSKDTETFYKFGFCFDCLLDRDFQMVKDGTFETYKKNYAKSKQTGFLTDAKIEIEEYLVKMEKGYIEYSTDKGKMERWEGDDLRKAKEFWEKELIQINETLEELAVS